MTPGKKGRLGALPRELGKDTKALRGDRLLEADLGIEGTGIKKKKKKK